MSLKRCVSGFALVELLVGLVIFGLLGGAMLEVVLRTERTVHAHLSRLNAEAALDTGVGFLGSELGALGRDSAGSDLLLQATDSLTYRAERGGGFACLVSSTSVIVATGEFAGVRTPQAGRDSLLIYTGMDDLRSRSGSWVAAPVLAVRSGSCGAGAGWDLSTTIDTTRVRLTGLPPLVPVRLFEVMQARLYRSAGATWLGARSVSAGETIQPLAGPFSLSRSGFVLRDSLGGTSSLPATTRRIHLGLSGPWAGWQRGGGAVPEESTGVSLAPGNLQP